LNETQVLVREKLEFVLEAMARSGYAIEQPVEIEVNERLPFMGYTSRHWQRHVIVVSGFAVKSPMLEGLLAHELSHVYRNLTNHPSHNEKIIGSVAAHFAQVHGLSEDYQRQILHQAVNHIQDLYADDIAVKVIQGNQRMRVTLEALGEFFLGWIKEEPEKSNPARKQAWLNAGILLNNCFAVSNIQRRNVEGYLPKAEALSNKFLMKINPNVRALFGYFNRYMVNLKEQVTENEFRKQLRDYLDHLWETIECL